MTSPDCNATHRGFLHQCPKCGDEDSCSVTLGDVRKLECTSCDAAFTASDIRALLLDWKSLLDWLETAPARHDQG